MLSFRSSVEFSFLFFFLFIFLLPFFFSFGFLSTNKIDNYNGGREEKKEKIKKNLQNK